MVEGMTAQSGLAHEQTLAASYVPAQRTSTEAGHRRHRAPTLVELVDNALMVIRRDSLLPSGYLVAVASSGAKHQHSVWLMGQFALLDDGWFGQVHGREPSGAKASHWLRKHERKCSAEHWTQFHWIDPALLDAGCGAGNTGLGLSPDGPTYCPGFKAGVRHPEHIPLIDMFKDGLRLLALEQRRA
jgi:hypothetical protein